MQREACATSSARVGVLLGAAASAAAHDTQHAYTSRARAPHGCRVPSALFRQTIVIQRIEPPLADDRVGTLRILTRQPACHASSAATGECLSPAQK